MDFIKSCVTNVQRFEDANVRYACYAPVAAGLDTESAMLLALTSLRGVNILCGIHDHKLYTFNAAEQSGTLDAFKVEERGTIQERHDEQGSSFLIETLKCALEDGVSFTLARQGIFRIGASQWFQSQQNDNCADQISLVRLTTQFVAPSTLQILVDCQPVSVLACSATDTSPGASAILSPSGLYAVALEVTQERQHTQETAWKSAAIKALQAQGIIIHDHDKWLRVRLLSRSTVELIWPQRLCFLRVSATQSSTSELESTQDPLSFAQQWIEDAEDRNRLLTQDDIGQPDEVAMLDDADFGPSPPFSYRPELSNMNGVYPTPPDGMIPSNATQATLHHESSLQAHSELNEGAELFRMQTNDASAPRERGPSITSSVGDFQQPVSDDLFGDDQAVFGGGEVQDNDFDFFDEQDDVGSSNRPQDTTFDLVTDETSATQPIRDESSDDVAMTVDVDTLTQQQPEKNSLLAYSSPVLEDSTVVVDTSAACTHSLHKTLSPFDIRERLLPRPVPASVATQQGPAQPRRQSSFAPLVFNPDLKLDRRLDSWLARGGNTKQALHAVRQTKVSRLHDDALFKHDYSSDDSSDEDVSQPLAMTPEQKSPPLLPWQSGKRKRTPSTDAITPNEWTIVGRSQTSTTPAQDNIALLRMMLEPKAKGASEIHGRDAKDVLALENSFDDTSKDLLMIAQLISEQALTCTKGMARHFSISKAQSDPDLAHVTSTTVSNAVAALLPSLKVLDLTMLASSKDTRLHTPSKNQPRSSPTRPETSGIELYHINAPYVRLQRADAAMEMLPPAIGFWESLSLGPRYGPKDVRFIFVRPDQGSLQQRLRSFSKDLKTTYESCRLGSVGDNTSGLVTDWLVPVSHGQSVLEQYSTYLQTCREIAAHLCEHAFTSQAQAFVILLIPPQGLDFTQWLCAAFWTMCKHYRERMIAAIKSGQSKKPTDLCLQILPQALFWSPHVLPVLSSKEMAVLAREIYDRCPPSKDVWATSFAIRSSPSFVLAETIPKRINFQLVANPPADLLHEGSELHVAYAKLGSWLTVCWCDSTGSSQQTTAFCLRGTSVAATFAEIWTRTLALLKARAVSWRIGLIARSAISADEVQCWREVISAQQHQRVLLHVSLVILQPVPLLTVRARSEPAAASAAVTPVSTPQSSSFTFSPDSSGQTAPPTPVSEPSAEHDPDARLVDLSDETWGMLLDPKLELCVLDTPPEVVTVAQGILLKHGKGENTDLPVLGIGVVFTLRVRSSTVEDATTKQSELMLRELMNAYRSLGLLTKARGLQHDAGMPIHAVAAIEAADALLGLLNT